MVEFQVIDIVASFNLLLGRPWLHDMWVVPLTLYQKIKMIVQEDFVVGFGDSRIRTANERDALEI